MDNKLILLNLVEKYRDVLHRDDDYIKCIRLLEKLNTLLIVLEEEKQLELNNNGLADLSLKYERVVNSLNKYINFTEEEMNLFTSPKCGRIISSFKALVNKTGWSTDTVIVLVKELQNDILQNRMVGFTEKEEKLDELKRIIDDGVFKDNYNLILDFVKMSVENKMLSYKDGVSLNFYILESCYSVSSKTDNLDDLIEEVILVENFEPDTDIREKLQVIFNKYGYQYSQERLGLLDEKFVRYCNLDYLDYVLSKFKDYNITLEQLYTRKNALYTIIIVNDREIFDNVLKFIDDNGCSLNSMLAIPSVFGKRKKNYIERSKRVGQTVDNVYTVNGCYQDFIHNIELYNKLAKVDKIEDIDLYRISVFLCTPAKLVDKNYKLLIKYGIISTNELPKAIVSLCGKNTEYIIDRMVELGLFEAYLRPTVTDDGVIKQARGTYYLDKDASMLRFYKMKKANDIGDTVFATNGGIKTIFTDNEQEYRGIHYDVDGNIVQKELTMDEINGILPDVRKGLPVVLQHQIDMGKIPMSDVASLHFKNLYKYGTYSPVEVFSSSRGIAGLKGDNLNIVFKKDYQDDISMEEMNSLLSDPLIKTLDEAIYCDVYGISKPLKVNEFTYEFMHPSFPNVHVMISRYKVLRLCKLLKENDLWVDEKELLINKENTLLSVVLKDSILCDTEMVMLRFVIRNFLTNGYIKVPVNYISTNRERGAR